MKVSIKLLATLIVLLTTLIGLAMVSGCASPKNIGVSRIAVLPFEDLSGEIDQVDNADFVRRVVAYPFGPYRVDIWWPFDPDTLPLIATMGLQPAIGAFQGPFTLQGLEETDAILQSKGYNTPEKIRAASPKQLGKILGVDGIIIGQVREFRSEVVSDYFSGYDFRVGQDFTRSSRDGGTYKLEYTFPVTDATVTSEGLGALRNYPSAIKLTQNFRLRFIDCKKGTELLAGDFELSGYRPYAVYIPQWTVGEIDFTNSAIFSNKRFPSVYLFHYLLLAKAFENINPGW